MLDEWLLIRFTIHVSLFTLISGKKLKKIINKLGSLKLTLTLFLLLGLMSAFGTFLPQGPDMGKWEELLGTAGTRIAATVGLVDFYHSLWFQLLLVGLSINMAACMWSRFPGMVGACSGQAALGRKPVLEFTDDDVLTNRLSGSVKAWF